MEQEMEGGEEGEGEDKVAKGNTELRTPKQLKLSETAHKKWSKKDISNSWWQVEEKGEQKGAMCSIQQSGRAEICLETHSWFRNNNLLKKVNP